MRLFIALFLASILVVVPVSYAADRHLPFTAEEDSDGARTLWFFYNISGMAGTKHAYIRAKDIPKSKRWQLLDNNEQLQPADIAWWPNAVAMLIDKEKDIYTFKNQSIALSELKKKFGKPVFRRFNTADKPLALTVFDRNKKASERLPAILPNSELYSAIYDLAINTRRASCKHNRDDVWVGIADTDEMKVYEVDHAGCITGEMRMVAPEFKKLISKMEKDGAFK